MTTESKRAGERAMRRLNLWLAWNHDKEERRLDAQSDRGIHLQNAGTFSSTYVRNPNVRYVYRLDYQPDLKWKSQNRTEYLELYADLGWEYVGTCMQWFYFRRPWTEDEPVELYSDISTRRVHYKRIQKMLGWVLAAEIFILIGEIINTHLNPVAAHLWPLLIGLGVVDLLLAVGFIQMTRKLRRM